MIRGGDGRATKRGRGGHVPASVFPPQSTLLNHPTSIRPTLIQRLHSGAFVFWNISRVVIVTFPMIQNRMHLLHRFNDEDLLHLLPGPAVALFCNLKVYRKVVNAPPASSGKRHHICSGVSEVIDGDTVDGDRADKPPGRARRRYRR